MSKEHQECAEGANYVQYLAAIKKADVIDQSSNTLRLILTYDYASMFVEMLARCIHWPPPLGHNLIANVHLRPVNTPGRGFGYPPHTVQCDGHHVLLLRIAYGLPRRLAGFYLADTHPSSFFTS